MLVPARLLLPLHTCEGQKGEKKGVIYVQIHVLYFTRFLGHKYRVVQHSIFEEEDKN